MHVGVGRVDCSVVAMSSVGLHSRMNVYAQLSLTNSLVSERRHRCSSSASPFLLMDGVLLPSLLKDPFEKGLYIKNPAENCPHCLPPSPPAYCRHPRRHHKPHSDLASASMLGHESSGCRSG